MAERPILMSAPMVRAILAGTKTQTRRAIKKPERYERIRDCAFCCPYGGPSDRLWVRETTQMRFLPNLLTGEPTNNQCAEYAADATPVLDAAGFDVCWWYSRQTCPGIHMPRWASRITLELTEVRVERLQEISRFDCHAEGIVPAQTGDWAEESSLDRAAYAYLWEQINGAGSWDANPWVWCLTFRRLP